MLLSEVRFEEMTDEQINALLFDRENERVRRADYAFLLGTEPTYARLRAEIAASYYAQGGTTRIVATGAAVSDPTETESAVMRRRLLELGVPADAVIEEPNARDTIGNMICSLGAVCARGNVTDVKTVTIITEPFHMRRSLALARLFLPRYIQVFGYTEHTEEQRLGWRADARLTRSVKTEVSILSALAGRHLIDDLPIGD